MNLQEDPPIRPPGDKETLSDNARALFYAEYEDALQRSACIDTESVLRNLERRQQKALLDHLWPKLALIQQSLRQSQELAKQKLSIAMDTYEAADRRIRTIDENLRRLDPDNSALDRQLESSTPSTPGISILNHKSSKTSRSSKSFSKHKKSTIKRVLQPAIEQSHNSSSIKRKSRHPTTPSSSSRRTATVTANPTTQEVSFDVPPDPAEPVYCFCQRVSYGKMIACETGDDCPYEWFHLGCVGLERIPKGDWYCHDCATRLHIKKTW